MEVNGNVKVPGGMLLPSITLYDKNGKIQSAELRCWIGEATSDATGQFVVDWSSAGFKSPH